MELSQAFKFCPRCAAKFSQKRHMLKCAKCGLSFYLNPKPVNSVILKNDQNEYLFVVRAWEPRKGYLDFPGGFVDEDEDFEESVRREIKEEIGIEVGPLEYLSTDKDRYMFDGINYKVAGISYTGALPTGALLRPADDVASIEFYKLENIPMKRLAWESMHRMIAQLKAKPQ